MDVNAHGVLNGQPAEYYERLAAEMKRPGESVYKKGGMNRDTLYFTQMFLRHRRALDLLCSRPEWSGHDLIVRGCSQGGTLALACAALDPRVTRVCAGVPSLCDVTHPGSVGKWLDADASGADTRRAKEAAAYVSVSNFAPRIKARAYFTAAFLDRSCDPETVYAAHNAYGGPKKIYNGPLAGHSDIPREIHYDDFTGFMTEMA
jgi:cephalosporin-C deacetylase